MWRWLRFLLFAALAYCVLTVPERSLGQVDLTPPRQPFQYDFLDDFLARPTIYIRPALGGDYASAQEVRDAVGHIQLSITCSPDPNSFGAYRDRGARVDIQRADGAHRAAGVLNTVIGATQMLVRNSCPVSGVDSYGMGFIDIYGPNGEALYAARGYALGRWGEFRDVVAESQAAAERAAQERAEAERQAQIYAEAQRVRAARAEASRRASSAFWAWVVGLGIAAAVLFGGYKAAQAVKRQRDIEDRAQRAVEEVREKERRERRARQEGYQSELRRARTSSLEAFSEIPRALMNAEELLDVAEKDFREEAFSPFWDAIERAVNKLGDADRNLQTIKLSADCYTKLLPLVEHAPPPFPVEPETAKGLIVANTTGARLKEIVRAAQRNFQFATIYEQRKTNQILVSGFNNLAEALTGLGDQMSHSIQAVCDQVEQVNASVHHMHAGIQSELRESREQQEKFAVEQARVAAQEAERDNEQLMRSKKELVMLDNIQRGKKPGYFDDRP